MVARVEIEQDCSYAVLRRIADTGHCLSELGVNAGGILGGSVVVETVFGWPGLGRLTFDAIFARDVNLLLGILFCSSLLVVITNLVTDLVSAWIDPRIEVSA